MSHFFTFFKGFTLRTTLYASGFLLEFWNMFQFLEFLLFQKWLYLIVLSFRWLGFYSSYNFVISCVPSISIQYIKMSQDYFPSVCTSAKSVSLSLISSYRWNFSLFVTGVQASIPQYTPLNFYWRVFQLANIPIWSVIKLRV